VRDFKKALADTGIKVPMPPRTSSGDPAFKDGAFTSNDRASAPTPPEDDERDRPRRGARGEGVRVLGRREESSPTRLRARSRPQALPRRAQLPDQLREGPQVRPRLRPRGEAQRARHDIYLPTTAPSSASSRPSTTRDGGVNPSGARAHVGAQLHARGGSGVGRGKLFHIDLNDQAFGVDQDLRFGSHSIRAASSS